LSDLRVNFAHFGGDDGVKNTVKWERQAENVLAKLEYDKLDKSTWTYTIIMLLKKHRNTYADISAFNFRDKKATLALAWLLALDHQGEFKKLGPHSLSEKLLWGSDYPMPIWEPKFDNYKKILSRFYKAIDLKNLEHRDLQAPEAKFGTNLPDRKDLLDKLTNRNAMKFLFEG
jgi:predicted TIM-barrel fold metal-dependent hydrolase